jgi:plastocyanin
MNAKMITPALALGVCLALAGCATSPQYPVTYQIPFGPAQVRSDFGPPNIVVNGVQDVPAQPGAILYYQVVSPINAVVYAFDKTGPGPGGPILSQLNGTSFYSSVVPTSNTVEFVVSATQPVTGGTVQLTVSDSSMAAGSGAIPSVGVPYPAQQPPVSITPSSVSIVTGQSVTFSVAGGAGTGGFAWGGAAPANGWSNTYTFNAPGTYTVTACRSGDASYAQSNTVAATVSVSPPVTPMPAYANPAVTVTPVR